MIPLCSNLTMQESNAMYASVLEDNDAKAMRRLCLGDLYFLLTVICNRVDMRNEWCYARCREVELNPDEQLDLWFRGGWKSSIITFGKTIQDILINPDETCVIFSHTRPIAKAFLSQIKRELETNTLLQDLFPDVLYKNPEKESPQWSLDGGIVVKRKNNPKECTIEAWGLVDGQPTSKHYSLIVCDDTVTRESVTSPEMIQKTTDAWSLSLNLKSERTRRRTIGTRYHLHDSYAEMIKRGAVTPRIYPATKDGTLHGESVYVPRDELDKTLRNMGEYIFSAQMLQNPVADKSMGFKLEWLMTYNVLKINAKWNYYLLVDGASSKKTDSDYTVMLIIGLGDDGNYYIVDGLRDRLNLTERAQALMMLHRKWKPKMVGYEKYGKDSDIEHIKYVQDQEQYRFGITELGGRMPKNDRIRRLVPLFESNRFWIPSRLLYQKVDGTVGDLYVDFSSEYVDFPVGRNDDVVDCASRIVDVELAAKFPLVDSDVSNSMPQRSVESTYDVLDMNRGQPASQSGEPNSRMLSWKDAMRNVS